MNTWSKKYVYTMYDEFYEYNCINKDGSVTLRPTAPKKWQVRVTVMIPPGKCGDDFRHTYDSVNGALESAKRAALRLLRNEAKKGTHVK